MGDVYSKAPVVTIGIHYIYNGQPKVKTLIFLSTYISTYMYIYAKYMYQDEPGKRSAVHLTLPQSNYFKA